MPPLFTIPEQVDSFPVDFLAVLLYFAPSGFSPTISAVLAEHGGHRTSDPLADWDLCLASSKELRGLVPSRTDQWIGGMLRIGHLTNKAALWQALVEAAGRAAARRWMPMTWLLDHPEDRHLLAHRPDGEFYIAKDPVLDQRRGLRLCSSRGAALEAAKDGLVVVQRLMPDLMVVGGHRFNLRLYVLLIRRDGHLTAWRHPLGRCIWTPQPMGTTPTEASVITRSVKPPPGKPGDMSGLISLLRGALEDDFQDRVDALLGEVVHAVRPKLKRLEPSSHNPTFHLLGADVVLTTRAEVRLIELNSGPDLRPRGAKDGHLKSTMVADLFRQIGLLPGPRCWRKLPEKSSPLTTMADDTAADS